jgi:hypothetical protein
MQILWLIGPTAMMVTSVITTGIVAWLDHHTIPERKFIKMLQAVKKHTAGQKI